MHARDLIARGRLRWAAVLIALCCSALTAGDAPAQDGTPGVTAAELAPKPVEAALASPAVDVAKLRACETMTPDGEAQIVSYAELVRNGSFWLGLAGWHGQGGGMSISPSAALVLRRGREAGYDELEGVGLVVQLPAGIPDEHVLRQRLHPPQGVEYAFLQFDYRLIRAHPSGELTAFEVSLATNDPTRDPQLVTHAVPPTLEAPGSAWRRYYGPVRDRAVLAALNQQVEARQPVSLVMRFKGQGVRVEVDNVSFEVSGVRLPRQVEGNLMVSRVVEGEDGGGYAMSCMTPDGARSATFFAARGVPRGFDWWPEQGVVLASTHESQRARWASDLYLIEADAAPGIRRVTSGPGQAWFTHRQDQEDPPSLGAVSGVIENAADHFLTVDVYVEGARQALTINLPPGRVRRFTLEDVADIGGEQRVVASTPEQRWTAPESVNVTPGATTTLGGRLVVGGEGASLGLHAPAWTGRGREVVAVLGDARLHRLSLPAEDDWLSVSESARVPEGAQPAPEPEGARTLVVRDEGKEPGVWLIEANGRPRRVVAFNPANERARIPRLPAWIPTGEGFVYVQRRCSPAGGCHAALVYHQLDLERGETLTRFEGEDVLDLAVSPNGRHIAVVLEAERAGLAGGPQRELWIVRVNNPAVMWRVGDHDLQPLGVDWEAVSGPPASQGSANP